MASRSRGEIVGQTCAEWDMQSIRKPVTAAWDLSISEENAQKLQKGFIPETMEDKWLCYSDTGDAEGVILVHLCRSWTRTEQIVLKLQVADGTKGSATRIIEITWEAQDADEDLGEEEAKEDAIMVCEAVLGCSLGLEEAD